MTIAAVFGRQWMAFSPKIPFRHGGLRQKGRMMTAGLNPVSRSQESDEDRNAAPAAALKADMMRGDTPQASLPQAASDDYLRIDVC